MKWQLRPPDTLSVSVNEGNPPTRDEVARFLGEIRPVVEEAAPRVVVVDGEAVRRRKGLSYPEIAGQIMYEAARARTARSASRAAPSLAPPSTGLDRKQSFAWARRSPKLSRAEGAG